jgi:hypothetical protein
VLVVVCRLQACCEHTCDKQLLLTQGSCILLLLLLLLLLCQTLR